MIFGRKHQAERDRALQMVRDAAASGRITVLDRDRRVEEIHHAQSVEEIESHVRDLRWPAEPQVQEPTQVWMPPDRSPERPVADRATPSHDTGDTSHDTRDTSYGAGEPPHGPSGAVPPGHATSGPSGPSEVPPLPPLVQKMMPGIAATWTDVTQQAGQARAGHEAHRPPPETPHFAAPRADRSRGCLIRLVIAAVVLFFVLPGVGSLLTFRSLLDFDSDSGSSRSEATERADAALLTRPGWERMIAALEEEAGKSSVTSVTVYEGYAVLVVTSQMAGAESYYYDGERLTRLNRGDLGNAEFSLRDLDFAVVRTALQRSAEGLEDLQNRYVIVRREQSRKAPTVLGYAVGRDATHWARVSSKGKVLECRC